MKKNNEIKGLNVRKFQLSYIQIQVKKILYSAKGAEYPYKNIDYT